MKILFDECVPWPLHRMLIGHECDAVARRGWAGIKNGQLLAAAEPHFDLFLTVDQGIKYQQKLSGRKIAVLQLSTNNLRRLLSAADNICAECARIQSGEFRAIEIT